jgi:choline dehydrogenase-like flavoprotein
MESKHYDVVIVGSGISGSVIAKTLTNAGKKVLILEAGLQAGIALEGEAAYNVYQDYIQTFYNAPAKVPNSPYPDLKDAPSIDVLQIQKLEPGQAPPPGYLIQKGPLPFASDCMRGPGGTTMHWLGTTLRMLPNDFRMKSVYDQNVDWPISYEHLKPYYEMAELEIGVSGNVQDQHYPGIGPDFFGEDYVYPMRKNSTELHGRADFKENRPAQSNRE